jgi:hypothetical protein
LADAVANRRRGARANATGPVLVVDNGFGGRIIRVASRNTYLPPGDAAKTVESEVPTTG